MHKLKWLVLGGLMLIVGAARADDFNVRNHGDHYQNASTGLRTNVNGDLRTVDSDRDRDFGDVTNAFTGVVLNQQTTFITPNAIDLTKYARAALYLSWAGAAASDSDSVFVMVRIWGKTSPSSNTLHLWTPLGTSVTAGDTCQCIPGALADSLATQRCLTPAPSFVIVRSVTDYRLTTKVLGQFVGLASGRSTLRKIPAYAWRYAGPTGVMLSLMDSAGNRCPYDYIIVEVANLSFTRNLTSLNCDVTRKAN